MLMLLKYDSGVQQRATCLDWIHPWRYSSPCYARLCVIFSRFLSIKHGLRVWILTQKKKMREREKKKKKKERGMIVVC